MAAGNGIYGGDAHGVAPEARLVWIAAATAQSMIEDCIRGARQPDVDILTNQLATDARLRDNRTVFSIIAGRLAEETGKLFMVSMSNRPPFLNNATVLAYSDGLLGITGYVSRDTCWAQFGLRAPKEGAIPMMAGGASPASDGGFGPFAMAPAAYIKPDNLSYCDIHEVVDHRGLYPLPVTYRAGNGHLSDRTRSSGRSRAADQRRASGRHPR